MLDRLAGAVGAAFLVAVPTHASAAPVDDLVAALRLDEVVGIMRDEGLVYADELAVEMLGTESSEGWRDTVGRIYDTDKMQESVVSGIRAELEDDQAEALADFFESDLGRRVVELELDARAAMVDPEVEEAARTVYRTAHATEAERLNGVEAFVEANDLVEQNVSGALNASLAFYRGLSDGGAIALTEEEVLADVWLSEEETRADTAEWLYGYLLMAYEPLDPEELARYTEMSDSPEGGALNRALFAGFNTMYNEISYAIGLAAARQMAGTEL
ncbi:hypothetical protein SAMN05444413_11199 [Roseivivax marinus]|uniref:DUF2059 domain-containing protein n=1 Tax=Roseivivax marinus TaxID=1379903 RepID=UPI0008B13F43|nr:DUF2059 domain-containing protein [Roseivivax marinus]SEL59279.1 hypothetical protein SAMN05444413_11199 [Roseivivax marinus]